MRKVLYILGQLSDEDVEWMARAGQRTELAANTVLIQEGVPIGHVYILLKGAAAVLVGGNREVARLGSGEVLGEMSLIDNRPPSATVRTTEAAMFLGLERGALERKMAADTGFAARFYRALAIFLADRVRNTNAQLGYGKPAEDRSLADEDEIDDGVLDNVHLAGIRMDMIMQRLGAL